MAWREREIEKLYYSIGEVAEMIGVDNTSKIRFWEMELEIDGKRNRRGERSYTVDEIALLALIRKAAVDLAIASIKRLLDEGGHDRLEEVVNTLAVKR